MKRYKQVSLFQQWVIDSLSPNLIIRSGHTEIPTPGRFLFISFSDTRGLAQLVLSVMLLFLP